MSVFFISDTGHGPQKLGGFDWYASKGLDRLKDLAVAALKQYQPGKVFSGMMPGWDTGLALGALELNIPLVAAVAYKDLDQHWPPKQQKVYRSILDQAEEIVVINEGLESYSDFYDRNTWMLEWSNLILALWDGKNGYTYKFIKLAQAKKIQVVNLWRSWKKYSGV